MMPSMPGTNLTRDEAQTRAQLLSVDSYTVELDLTTSETTFATTTTIAFGCTETGAETFVDLVGATIHEVTLNGVSLDPAEVYHDNRIQLSDLQQRNELVVRADCPYSHTGEGLHRFVDPADDRVYTYTQFEVPDARRVFATFEQPDLKSVFTFHVTAPDTWVVVSNAPTPEPETLGEGKALWRFPATEPMSTYITAVIAGEYHAEFDSYQGKFGEIPLGHYCRQSLVQHMDTAELVKLTRQGFAFFEDAFDYPYPFHKYDQLYVPEYNMGAMENAGAVTLRDEYLPRSRQDAAFYEFRCSVILHEMAHMWFGDLVTMKWWDDLWLNESFAEWACYHAAVEATEFDESWTGFTNARKNWALRQDQLPSTHPIAADNYDLQAVEVNFDGITYAKGASVLKQLVAWVGLENFLVGLRGYFRRHAFGNSEFSDLLGALEESSERELDSWAKEWLQTSGVNTLTPQFEVDEAGSYTSFAVQQTATVEHPTLRRHRIAIGLYDLEANQAGDERLVRRTQVEVDVEGEATKIAELVGCRQPDLLLLNDGDLTYAKIRLDERSLATVIGGLSRLDDSLARALCWGAAWDMTRDAELSATDFVTLVLANIATETDAFGSSRIPGYAAQAVNNFSAPANRAALRQTWEQGSAQAAGRGRAGQRPPADVRQVVRGSRPQRRGAGRPRGAARRLPGHRRPGRRHGPALGAAQRPGSRRSRDRGADRRGAAAGQHHLRPGARRCRPDLSPHRRREGRGLGDRGRPRRRAQRDPAQRGAVLHAAGPGRSPAALCRAVPRGGRDALGGEGHPACVDGPGVPVPAPAGVPGAPRPGERVAARLLGQPGCEALRARRCGGRRALPRRPGDGRPGVRYGGPSPVVPRADATSRAGSAAGGRSRPAVRRRA